MPKIDIIPTEKVYFDSRGEIHLPAGVKVWEDVQPRITPREWKVYLFIKADKSKMDDRVFSRVEAKYCGDRVTRWRAESSLKEKGYL